MFRKIFLIFAVLLAGFSANAQLTKVKVLIDNDFCGDPDGLFQLAHQVLCPSTEIVGIVGGHLKDNAGFTDRKDQATQSVENVNALLDVMGLTGKFRIVKGSETAMTDDSTPADSEGTRLIIEEAKKCSPEKPLYVVCGAALTNVASALLIAPEISKNIIICWIGGQEYSFGACPPPGYSEVEYNLSLCIPAGQVVFNKSDVMIWQIPRDVYRQCMYSTMEMHARIATCGKPGKYISDAIDNVINVCEGFGIPMGETYIMGDSPLVLLTSLQSGFEADPASCRWTPAQCPIIGKDGKYLPNPKGRTIRVYTQVDTRLMFADFELRLADKYGK
ncbi:MAG: nucleoside hydrolase [Muribaculaceae bacterium]